MLQVPYGDVSSFCYKSRLNCLNFTVCELKATPRSKITPFTSPSKNKLKILKSGPIYVPDLYINVIKQAKKKGQKYDTKEMCHSELLGIKGV